MELTERLKERAHTLGFSAVGVTSAEAFGTSQKCLPGARSIVSVAFPYATLNANAPEGLRGRVARFACGRDYHKEVGDRLRALGEWLSAEVNEANWGTCVDTGPIVDRAAAREAGVGSYGKNATIITPESGSWVVLGELVTDILLDFDEPAPKQTCGSCSKCIEACPSGAIVDPFVVDRRRCVSQLTQMKGSIPRELRPFLGDRIYGCDTCQEVCPKNVGVAGRVLEDDTGLGATPDLIALLGMNKGDYDRLVKPTTMSWIGRSRLRRNAAVALGNAGDESAIPALSEAMRDPQPLVRSHVAWALGQIGGDQAMQPLHSALESETDESVMEEIREALRSHESAEV